MALVEARQLVKTYRTEEVEVTAIRNVSFTIEAKSFVSFVGPSGSGKSTLLNMIGCLDPPTSGSLLVAGRDIQGLDRRGAARFRGETIGFIFQDFNLLPVLTVYENIEYPLLMVRETPAGERRQRVLALIEAVGMNEQRDKYPDQLSGGQKLVLADEPTANLDHQTAFRVIELMKKMRDEFATTFIFSTHDPKVVGEAEIVHTLEDGRLKNSAPHTPGGPRHD